MSSRIELLLCCLGKDISWVRVCVVHFSKSHYRAQRLEIHTDWKSGGVEIQTRGCSGWEAQNLCSAAYPPFLRLSIKDWFDHQTKLFLSLCFSPFWQFFWPNRKVPQVIFIQVSWQKVFRDNLIKEKKGAEHAFKIQKPMKWLKYNPTNNSTA